MEIVGLDEIQPAQSVSHHRQCARGRLDHGTMDMATRRVCAMRLAKAARDLGATVMRHNRVVDIRPRPSGEWEVVTEQGTIVAEMVVNAAGCYARQVAAMVGADAPITNMQHHYVVTHPIQAFLERSEEIPVMRDSYTSGYFRQEQKSGLMGIYESTGPARSLGAQGLPGMGGVQRVVPGRLGSHRAVARTGHRAHADLRRGGDSPRHQRRHSAHARRRAAARARRRA